jgi:uncharacterized protein YegJ (DUF2314 family)
MGLLSKIFGKKNVNQRAGEPDMIYVPNEDKEMAWAIEKANLTLWYFEESLKKPQDFQSYFSVKVQIFDGEISEHIWLNDPKFDIEGNLFGTVGNEPVNITTVKLNQEIGVDRNFISDWMIIENNRLIGGYTIRAIREGLPDHKKNDFDKSIGIPIDAGIDYFKVDFNTPEGAILSLEQAYTAADLAGALACKDFSEEAKLMLTDFKIEIDNEIIHTTAEALELSFINHIEENGFPNFAEIKNAFPKREKITENHYLITEVCWLPDMQYTVQKINVYKTTNGWRVLSVANENV